MTDDLRNTGLGAGAVLSTLDPGTKIMPEEPRKRINDGDDLAFFLRSRAYTDIVTFVGQLNRAMFPTPQPSGEASQWSTRSADIELSPQVLGLRGMLQALARLRDETPPESGPRRFGNAAFRTWYAKVKQHLPTLLHDALSLGVWGCTEPGRKSDLERELSEYLLGGLGSVERLDYGTGHELSFLAFLMCVWKLNGFTPGASGNEERGIVVGIIEPYLELVRDLIRTYTLEPAGSHGVWGLDDHSFIPFILGSAQWAPPVHLGALIPDEGSFTDAPRPDKVVNEELVRSYAPQNMYFAAVAFIYDVKNGPFWEHSPTLYDISGIRAGWAKINKGLIKMYRAEVLSKFPVVQHLRFGSILKWEEDHEAARANAGSVPSVHAQSQPKSHKMPPPVTGFPRSGTDIAAARPTGATTAAPWTRMAPPPTSRPSGQMGPPGVVSMLSGSVRTLPNRGGDAITRRPP